MSKHIYPMKALDWALWGLSKVIIALTNIHARLLMKQGRKK